MQSQCMDINPIVNTLAQSCQYWLKSNLLGSQADCYTKGQLQESRIWCNTRPCSARIWSTTCDRLATEPHHPAHPFSSAIDSHVKIKRNHTHNHTDVTFSNFNFCRVSKRNGLLNHIYWLDPVQEIKLLECWENGLAISAEHVAALDIIISYWMI